MRSGLSKVAVYKDDRGYVHKCSAVCPHLGAMVHWNDSEKTWDCPAHGSRFDEFGRVVTGPANCDMKKLPNEALLMTKEIPAVVETPTVSEIAELRR
jgi:Rieske Fe-S protein